MADESPESELDTGTELLRRKLGLSDPQARAILILLIPWLIKRHKRLS